MNVSMRRFVVSFTVTLVLILLAAGVVTVTLSGRSMLGISTKINLSYDDIITAGETADNALTFCAPKFKAAAQIFLILCAALSKLY